MKEELQKAIASALAALGLPEKEATLEHPGELSHGDYSTNIALALAKEAKQNPRVLAEKMVAELQKKMPAHIEKIEIAGPGFINFHCSPEFFSAQTAAILAAGGQFGHTAELFGTKVLCEYTQPNPFKDLHIGHMMNNIVGEALSRLIAASGAEVKRVTYHGDVGLHVAKTIWGVLREQRESAYGTKSDDDTSLTVTSLGQAYAQGNTAYEEDEQAKKEITELNKKIYERSNDELNALYEEGKKVSLDHFKKIYTLLGSHFDHAFLESQTAPVGKKIVEAHIADGIFEKSDGAIIFKGEKYDPSLHTRVFISKEGIPTYEAKDLGLVELKKEWWDFDRSLTVTAEEQTQYFRVLKKAMELVFPEYAGKIEHVPHGMLKLPTGKMSSRTGTIVPADEFIYGIRDAAKEKMQSVEKTAEKEIDVEKVSLQVALAAIKYSILKQAPGRDVIFDTEKALSFEGDSGPYLQYTAVRAASILEKAKAAKLKPDAAAKIDEINAVEKLLYRLPEIAERARIEYAPQHLVTFLTELASAFNSYYAHTKIVTEEAGAAYRVALTEAVQITLHNGLAMLGIEVPEKM